MKGMIKKTSIAWLTALFLLVSVSALAHVHWVILGQCNPPVGTPVELTIAGGHDFPKSSLAVGDKLVYQPRVIAPDGSWREFTSARANRKRVGEVTFEVEGIHIISFCLKKPRMADPIFCSKSIVQVGVGAAGDVARKLGAVLEIVPGKNPLLLKKGDELPLQVFSRGKPIAAAIEVHAGGEKTFMLGTDEQGRATLILERPGPYLLTTEVAGKGATLTFCFAGESR